MSQGIRFKPSGMASEPDALAPFGGPDTLTTACFEPDFLSPPIFGDFRLPWKPHRIRLQAIRAKGTSNDVSRLNGRHYCPTFLTLSRAY